VSGVVFRVKGSSPHRDVGGRPVYFCCEACAVYFSEHRESVLALRSLSPSR
jgi:YHS domain-containing protein